MDLREVLIGQSQVVPEVDGRTDNAERLAGDGDIRGGKPEPGSRFNVIALAGGGIGKRPRLKLRPRRPRQQGAEEDDEGNENETRPRRRGMG